MFIDLNKLIDKLPSFTLFERKLELKVVLGFLLGTVILGALALTFFDFFPRTPVLAEFTGSYAFADTAGGSGDEIANQVMEDSAGNIIVVGSFEGNVDFDPGVSVDEHESEGFSDIFISKFDSNQNYLWTQTFGGTGDLNYGDYPVSAVLDSSDNIYILGEFANNLDINPAGLTFDTSTDLLNSAANVLDGLHGTCNANEWSTDNEATGGYIQLNFNEPITMDSIELFDRACAEQVTSGTLTFSSGGSVAVGTLEDTGTTGSTLNFSQRSVDWVRFTIDSSVGGANVGISEINFSNGGNPVDVFDLDNIANGYSDIFLAGFDSDGNSMWTRDVGSANVDLAYDLVIDGNSELVFSYSHSDTIDVDDSFGEFELTIPGGFSSTTRIARYDTDGNFLNGGGTGISLAGAPLFTVPNARLGVDSSNNTYHYFTGDELIGILKQNSSHNLQWLHTISYTAPDDLSISDIAVDANYVYLVGSFEGTIDFDPTAGTDSKSAVADSDMFITRFDLNGNYVSTVTSDVEEVSAIELDDSSNMYLLGWFNGTFDFDPTAGTDTIASSGDDTYVTKFLANGSYDWTISFDDNSTLSPYDHRRRPAMYINAAEDVYVAGAFAGVADLDGTSGIDTASSNGGTDYFVSKHNSPATPTNTLPPGPTNTPMPTSTPVPTLEAFSFPSYSWTNAAGSSSSDETRSVATDSQNSVYAGINFIGQNVDLNGNPIGSDLHSSTYNNTLSTYSTNVALVKYNQNGTYAWGRSFGTAGTDILTEVTTDSNNNVFAMGTLGSDNIDLNPGAGVDNRCEAGKDGFLVKYNSSGNYVWGRCFANIILDASTDVDGNVYAVSQFSGTRNFNDAGGTDEHTASVYGKMAITRYNADGSYGWTVSFGSNDVGAAQFANSIEVNQEYEEAYITGYFNTSGNFYLDSEESEAFTSNGQADAFIGGYSIDDGSYVAGYTYGGPGNDYGTEIVTDQDSYALITGSFSGTVDFSNGDDPSAEHTSAGGSDIYIMRYDVGGLEYDDVKVSGGTGDDTGSSVDIIGNQFYVTGSFRNTSMFTLNALSGSGTVGQELTSAGGTDIFLLTGGIYNFGFGAVNKIGSTNNDTGYAIDTAPNGDMFVGGNFRGTVDFNMFSGVDNRSSLGGIDSFVTKYGTAHAIPQPSITPTPTTVVSSSVTPTPGDTAFPTTTPQPTPIGGEYQIINLPATLDAQDMQGNNIEDGSEHGLQGENSVRLRDVSNDETLAVFPGVVFDHDLDWNNITADSSLDFKVAYVHVNGELDGFSGSYTLYVPRSESDPSVRYCPGVSSLTAVNLTCESGFNLSDGASVNGVTATAVQDSFNNDQMWTLEGATNTGGISSAIVLPSPTPTVDPEQTGTGSPTPEISGLPDTGGEEEDTSDDGLVDTISNFLVDVTRPIRENRVVADVITPIVENIAVAIGEANLAAVSAIQLMPIATVGATNLITYPRFLLYGFAWIKGRKKQKTWGIVYDSESNEPIAFTSVRLYQGETFIQEQITNLDGKYGFAVGKGKYTIKVDNPDFTVFEKEVEVTEEGRLAIDIGLNRQRKATKSNWDVARQRIRENLGRLNTAIVIGGFIFSIVATIISPEWINFLIVGFYVVQFIILIALKYMRRRTWGYVYDSKSKHRLRGVFVRVFDKDENRQVDVQMTDDAGRYGFNLESGIYRIKAEAAGYSFPSSQQKDIIESKTGDKFIEVKLKKGEQLDLAIAVDPKSGTKSDSKAEKEGSGKLKSPF